MLRKCIAAVHQGQIWANSEELSCVLAALANAPQPQMLGNHIFSLLSKREREVVAYLVEGRTNREIAETLGISQHTVKNYLFKIFEKVGMSNRVELVFHLLSNGSGPFQAKGALNHEENTNPTVSQRAQSSVSSARPSPVSLAPGGRALRTG